MKLALEILALWLVLPAIPFAVTAVRRLIASWIASRGHFVGILAASNDA